MLESQQQIAELELHEGPAIYGLGWGDPQEHPALREVLDGWLLPNVTPETVALEIGSGGGRWTRFLNPCKLIYSVDGSPKSEQLVREAFATSREYFLDKEADKLEAIDPHESLATLQRALSTVAKMMRIARGRRLCENVRFIVSDGKLPIPSGSVDYVFSFDTFVHFERELFDAYLSEIARVLKPGGVLHLHYAVPLGERSERFCYRDPLEVDGQLMRIGFGAPKRRKLFKEGWGAVLVEYQRASKS